MAKTNFNFQATLKLRTDEFKKGVRDIQKSLNGLKSSFMNFAGALGLTLGLGKFTSMMKDTAVRLDTAKNVLKNVSEGTAEYAQNLDFLRGISEKYGQDLIVLINNFGQFRAAAKSSKLDIDELRSVYESLTRAAGAYHMSADRTNDMMVAVTQMFSKGKIAAEELRRQLGNSLPGAFNIMAKAAGMAGITANGTTAELEDMMRKGKVLADDVMPTFAKILDQITATANFDSLQQSMNRLKNSWTEFVEKADFGSLYKGLVDFGTKGLKALTNNFNLLKGSILGLLAGTVWSKLGKSIKTWSVAAANDLDRLNRTLDGTRKNIAKFNVDADAMPAERDHVLRSYTAAYRNSNISPENLPDGLKKLLKAQIAHNNALIARNQLEKDYHLPLSITKDRLKEIEKENIYLGKMIESNGKTAMQNVTGLQVAWGKLKGVMRGVWTAMKAAFSSILVTALVTAISTLIMKLVEYQKEWKRINNLVEDTKAEVDRVSGAESDALVHAVRLRRELDALKDKQGTDQWLKKMNELNEVMGRSGKQAFGIKSQYDEVVKALNDWIDKMKKIARYQAIINKMNELTAKNLDLEAENQAIKNDENYGKTRKNYQLTVPGVAPADRVLTSKASKLEANLQKNTAEIAQNNKAIENLEKMLKDEGLEGYLTDDENNGGGGGGDIKGTPVEKIKEAVDDYNKKLAELNNQFKHGAISLEEYNNEYDKVITDTFKKLAGFSDADIAKAGKTGFFETLKTLFKGIGENIDDKEIENAAKALGEKIADDIKRGLDKTTQQRMNDRKAEDLFREANALTPKKRDTAFDYRKTGKRGQADIANENYENQKDYLERLRELYNQLAALGQLGTEQMDKLAQKIGEAAQNTTNFRDAAKLAEWKADIEELSKAYNDKLYSSVRDVTSSLDRLYRLYAEMAEMFGEEIDPDNGFAKMLTVITALMDTFETIYTVVKSINELTAAASALEQAKENAKMKALEQEIGLTAALGTAQVTASEAATAALVGETVAAKALGEALKNVAAGAATANAMSVPYPGNLAALASNMAAIATAYGSIKAFKNGGVVGAGPKTGDHTLIRANRGEMVLPTGMQETLFNAIKNGNLGGGGQVDFRIKGTDLVGTLNNYNQKRKG